MSGKRARQIRKSETIKSVPIKNRRYAYRKIKENYTRGLITIPE